MRGPSGDLADPLEPGDEAVVPELVFSGVGLNSDYLVPPVRHRLMLDESWTTHERIGRFANRAIGQLDKLLEEFKRLREQSKYDDLSDFGHESQVLASRFQAALGRLAIPNSSYWQEAESLRGSSPHVRVLGLNAIAEALRTDIDKPESPKFPKS
jgi:hypothetical protein